MASTTSMAAASGTMPGAGAQVPYTGTFAFSTGGSTTQYSEYTFVGQILNNGETNWVAGPNSEPYYLLTSSASGAEETVLGDGETYYYTTGPRPVIEDLGSVVSTDQASATDDVTLLTGSSAPTNSDDSTATGASETSNDDGASMTESGSAPSDTNAAPSHGPGVQLAGVLALSFMLLAFAL